MQSPLLLRLRNGDTVVGYERREGNSRWYSRNLSAWTGKCPEYKQTDRCTGYRDKNRRLIFENDIVKVKSAEDELLLEVIFDEMIGRFFLKEYDGEEFFGEDLLKENQFTGNIEWYSFTFIQNNEDGA